MKIAKTYDWNRRDFSYDTNVMGYSKKSIYKIISNIDKRILSYDSIDIESVVQYERQIGLDVPKPIYHLVSYSWTGKYAPKIIDGFGHCEVGFGHCEVPNLCELLRDIKLNDIGI